MGEAKRRRDAQGASADQGFAEYRDRVRKHFPKIKDMEIGKGWMRGEALKTESGTVLLIHRPGEAPRRSDDEVTLWVSYAQDRFTAIVPPDLLDVLCGDWESVMRQALPPTDDPRSATRNVVMEWLLTHAEVHPAGAVNHPGAIMAAAIAWLLLSGPMGSLAKMAMRTGTHRQVGFAITDLPGERNYNWRTMMLA
jgi:hypothetical protein